MIMKERPNLDNNLSSSDFREYYYLKEELVNFCKRYDIQTTGSKAELTERIASFLESKEKTYKKHSTKKNLIADEITLDTKIEDNFVCSEKHRLFYKNLLGNNFSFNVAFQKWLKSNAGKTYSDSIRAYYQILEDKKNKTKIDKQFEYNTYIRDFFNNNKNKTLKQAIMCWKYKKNLKGHNKYEKSDLQILNATKM